MGHQGQNHSKFEYVCGACQKRCDHFLPDNRTPIPVCQTCWNSLSVMQRLTILGLMKQSHQLDSLVNLVAESIRSGDIMTGSRRVRKNEGN